MPFDAVLVIAFGGPQGIDDIRPFLANVLKGRRVAPNRVEEVAHHYELFDGVSPLTELTRRQARGLEAQLARDGTPLPVYVGMRNWHPYLADTLAEMSRAGVRRAIGFIAAAHRSYSSCTQYRENVADARAELRRRGLCDVEITYVGDWHTHEGFIDAAADRVEQAYGKLPPTVEDAPLIFTAHSIPVSMAERYPYERQYHESAGEVAGAAGIDHHVCVYQSRSGRPEDPWLGPDICDYLREQHALGRRAAVLCPIGFLCDHVEVLYDLDIEAATVARELGMTLARAEAVNDHPRFIETMAHAVRSVIERHRGGRPLQIAVRGSRVE